MAKNKVLKVVLINLLVLIFVAIFIMIAGEIFLRIYRHIDTKTDNAVGIGIYQSDDLNTWEMKPFSKAINGYGDPRPTIYINNIGLRDDDFTYNEKQQNVLMIGDSMTFGTGVNGDETFPEILQSKLKVKYGTDWNVINAGHIGYTIDNYYLLLKKYYEIVKPKVVVINLFMGNDITELRKHDWQQSLLGDIEKVHDQEVVINENNQLTSYLEKEPVSYFFYFLNKRWEILRAKWGFDKDDVKKATLTWPVFLKDGDDGYDPKLPTFWEKFFYAMDLIQKFAKEKDVTLVFTIVPMDVQVSKAYWNKYAIMYFGEDAFEAKRPQAKITEYCKEKGLNCLDLLPGLAANKNKNSLYYSKDDPHFDKSGHASVAELIYNYLANNIIKK